MKYEKASTMLEIRLQKLLWEYIRCLEQYCLMLYKINPNHPYQDSIEQLDRFIIILRTMRKLLQTLYKQTAEERFATPSYSASRKEK